MRSSAPVRAAELDQSDWNVLEYAVRRLESAWNEGAPAELGEYLPRVPDSLRLRILIELVLVDQEYRWRRGERPLLELYLDDWPELRRNSRVLCELLTAECATRAAAGALPSVSELRERFPELADRIDLPQIAAEVAREVTGHRRGHTTDPPLSDAERTAARDLQPGETFGRYEIRARIGSGGMGVVYRAWDAPLNREVALKLPSADVLADTRVLQGFLEEARSAAGLSHPNICTIYDAGEIDGTPYLTMAYLEGPHMSERLKQGQLEIPQAVDWVRCLAGAVQFLHERRILHRDIKPANVLFGASGEPMLTDFGIADRTGGPAGLSRLAGTPAYIAPEHLTADSPPDRRSDVYGLGVLLYELLTGTPPFQGDALAVLAAAVQDEPPPPSKLRRGVDAALRCICRKAMAKHPDDRFQTAGELAAALQAWQTKRLTRRPLSWLRVALVSAVLSVCLVLALFASGWLPTAERSDDSPLARAVRQARATIIAEVLQNPAPDEQLVSKLRRELLGLCRSHPREPELQNAAQLLNALPWPTAGESEDGATWHNLRAVRQTEGSAFELQLPSDGSLMIRRQYARSDGKHLYRLSYAHGPIAIQIIPIDEGLHPFLTTRNSQYSNTEGKSRPVLYHVFPEGRATAPGVVDLGVEIWGKQELASEKWYVLHIWPLSKPGKTAPPITKPPPPSKPLSPSSPGRALAEIEDTSRQLEQKPDPARLERVREQILGLVRDHPRAAELPRAATLLTSLPWPQSADGGTSGLWLRRTAASSASAESYDLAAGGFLVMAGSCTPESYTDGFALRLATRRPLHLHAVSLTPGLVPHLRQHWDGNSNSHGGWQNGTLFHRFELPAAADGDGVELHVRLHDHSDNRQPGEYLLYVWQAAEPHPPDEVEAEP